MKIEKFEDIVAWQKGKELTLLIYRLLKDSRDFDFRSQIYRATVSIMNNIAEGFERRSNKELKHFLFIAKGSSAEVRSMSYVALELKYISKEEFDTIYKLTTDVSKILSGFIKSI